MFNHWMRLDKASFKEVYDAIKNDSMMVRMDTRFRKAITPYALVFRRSSVLGGRLLSNHGHVERITVSGRITVIQRIWGSEGRLANHGPITMIQANHGRRIMGSNHGMIGANHDGVNRLLGLY